MQPALSVIFFTVVSGSGYGLLFLLGLALALDPSALDRTQALAALGTGMVFAAAGLTSSLFHLGQPQRAWRSLSQWRSSWLSREGVAALCSFVPALALAALLLRGEASDLMRLVSALLAGMGLVTVYCTAGIYTSLKTIHAWRNGFVLPGYLAFGLLGGAAWLWLLHDALGPAGNGAVRYGLPGLVAVSALSCWLLKRSYWHFIDSTQHPASIETATGLGRFGSVSSVETPHTEENYLTREMGFVLARKHARKLRNICVILFGVAPMLLALIAMLHLAGGQWSVVELACSALAAICATAGAFVERWLFFAQARHVVMLYYGTARVAD
jgi:sulfite dehydrogenase (quinone) subunit SoeC